MKGAQLRDGLLCQEQDSLPGGMSREGSMCDRRDAAAPSLAEAVKENWVGAPNRLASHPISELVGNGGEEEAMPGDIEDEFEGVCAANASSDDFSDVGDDTGPADTEVVFVKEGVCVFPTPSRRQRIMGRLSLIKQYNCLFICWLPYAAGAVQQDVGSGSGSSDVPSDGGSSNGSAQGATLYAVHPIPLSDVRAIHKHTPPLGQHRITLTLATGVSLPSLYFQNGGVKAFLSCLRLHTPLLRSADDANTYLVNDTADPLQRSLCSLELADVLSGGPSGAAGSAFPACAAGSLAASQWQQGAADGDMGLRAQLSELVDRFQQLTQNARDTASSIFSASMLLGTGGLLPEPQPSMALRSAAAAAALAGGDGSGSSGSSNRSGPGAALERRRSSLEASTNLGVFELIEGGAAAVMGTAAYARPPPLSLAELNTFFDAEGRLTNLAAFKQRVHRGGVEPEARPEAWKLLLGLHAPGSTRAERQAEVERRRQAYQQLRSQWRGMSETQQARCSKWRERRTRIEKDVRRTDCSHRFFARERSQAHTMLRHVLLTYERYNQDLGYVQGMSDLASPCLYVMRSAVAEGGQLANREALGVEAEAFWCFAALMERMESNFSSDSRAMHAQLLALRSLVQLLDPPLFAHLEAHDCLSFFFCYRWLLIDFKREFAFDEVLRLWEALWAGVPGLNLFVVVAVLEHHRRRILSEVFEFDAMLKFCVELSGRLRLEPLLRDAEVLATYAGDAGRDIVATSVAALL